MEDFATYLGLVPAFAARLLRNASEVIDGVLMGTMYATDDRGDVYQRTSSTG